MPWGGVPQSSSVTNAFAACHLHISRPFRERRSALKAEKLLLCGKKNKIKSLERQLSTVWRRIANQPGTPVETLD